MVSDVRQRGIANVPAPEAYEVIKSRSRMYLVLRTSMRPASLTGPVRAAVTKLDPALPLISVRTMDDVIADNSQSQQFLSLLVGSFAGLAALLAAVGIYGVLSYAVTQRTREIGIRISLGATQGRVLAEVLREGMLLAAVGSAIGIAGALAAGKILTTLALPGKARRPVHYGCHDRIAGRGGAGGVLSAGAPRSAAGPDECAATRMSEDGGEKTGFTQGAKLAKKPCLFSASRSRHGCRGDGGIAVMVALSSTAAVAVSRRRHVVAAAVALVEVGAFASMVTGRKFLM